MYNKIANVVKKPLAIQVVFSDSDQELNQLEADLQSKDYTAYRISERVDEGKTRPLIGAFRTEKGVGRVSIHI